MKKIIALLALIFCTKVQAQIITTIAGDGYGAGTGMSNYSGDGGQATLAEMGYPSGVTFDTEGNLYISDNSSANVIRKVNTAGIITTVAGNASSALSYTGDGGQATAAGFSYPQGVVVAMGNLYIADQGNFVIRKVVLSTGIITTIAGGGTSGLGDGGQATAAELGAPSGIIFDAAGNYYIADNTDNRIRKVNTLGIITTIVGNGTAAYNGDGGQATAAEINSPWSIALDATGNIYFSDQNNNCIRKVNTAGIISTFAGTGTGGYSGDGGQATAAELSQPYGISFDAEGNLYIADLGNVTVRMINTSGVITTVAGTGAKGYSGNGGQATVAKLNDPIAIAFDALGNLYIDDAYNNVIRKITYSQTQGTKEFASSNKIEINVYPNPSNGTINLMSTNNIDELKITDILGQTVYESKPSSENATLQIDNSGVYFITTTTGKEIITKKVIVNK